MDNYIRNKKYINYFIKGFVLIFIVIVIIIVLLNGSVFSSGDYLIVGDDLAWKKVDNVFYQVNPKDEKISGDFILFNGSNKINATKIEYKDDEFLFYNGNNLINMDEFRIAYKGFSDIKLADVSLEGYDDLDEDYILEVANTEDEKDFDIYRLSLKKVSYNFDGSGETTLYTMSDYMFGDGYRTPYSYMFLVKDGIIVDSIYEIDSNVYNLTEVIDLNNDGVYEVIVSKGVSSGKDFDMCYQIYNVKGDNITLKQDCKYLKEKG